MDRQPRAMIPGNDKQIRRESTANYYALLGIDSTASRDEVNNAYRRLAEFYMDPESLPEDWEPISAEMFNHITQAFRVLSDNTLRTEYDAQLQSEIGDPPAGGSGGETEGVESQSRDDIPESWRKERQYFEEHFEEIFKPLPKVDLIGKDGTSDPAAEYGLITWEMPDAPAIEESTFGTLPSDQLGQLQRALPQARRAVPYRVVDTFQVMIVAGIVLMSLVIIGEVVYLYGGQ